MKYTALYIGFLLLFAPSLAFAQAQPQSCSVQGYTVVFVNGIFDTKTQAEADKDSLKYAFGMNPSINNQNITFQLGYNPTHLAGAGDLVQSFVQQFNSSVTDFDLDTILIQIHPEVTTRKLLLVGHSQGTFYTNEMYAYLLAHGEPKEALAVYNVASPATYTAGGGKYINSSGDSLLQLMRLANPNMLPNNVDLVSPNAGSLSGHGFVEDYLGGASDRILSEVDTELNALVPTYASATEDCFTPPDATVGYQTQQVLFAVADPTAMVLKVGGVTTFQAGVVAIKAAAIIVGGAFQFVADSIHLATHPPTEAVATQKTNTIANKLYGSSLEGLSAQDKKDLLGSSQGGAVVLALPPKKSPVLPGIVLGTSTELSVSAPTSTPSVLPAPQGVGGAPLSIFPSSSNGPVLGGGGAPAPVAVAAPVDTTTADTSSNNTPPSDAPIITPPDTTPPLDTPPPTPPAPVLPTGAPFTDSFDSYTSDPATSAWSVFPDDYNRFIRLPADTGSADTFLSDTTYTGSNDCHSGNCLIGDSSAGGLGGGGHSSVMYKESGVGQDSGAFTIWARSRAGWRLASADVGLCAGLSLGCTGPNVYGLDSLGTNDDMWHQYYIAWRQGSASVESCVLQDDTNRTDCTWKPSSFPLGTQFDGIVLSVGAVRSDLGDQGWFDDLENAPQ